MPSRTLGNVDIASAMSSIPDLQVHGNGDQWKLLCKASSKAEQWMKSTKAMEVPGGCIVQVTTQQNNNVAEALVFIPGANLRIDNFGQWTLI